ncbi:MAG: hypothetical protein ACRCYP_01925 [Alphaproteobacteria bacterium]
MLFFFAWVLEEEIFDPKQHLRQDESIFSLYLEQKEGHGATARILVKNDLQRLDIFQQKRYGILSIKREDESVHCLFKGKLTTFSTEGASACVWLTLTAEAEDLKAQFEKQVAKLEQPPFWDPLFVDADAPKDPYEWMKVQPVVFYVDRITGNAEVGSFFHGNQTLNMKDQFFHDSLSIKPRFTPQTSLEMTLEAQWVQRVRGYVNLGKRIANLFPEKMINTFTGKKFEKAWPKPGRTLGKSGYWVAVSRLEEVTPPKTGGVNLYPTQSRRFRSYNPQNNRTETHFLKRFWFKARLILGWDYRQKRVEKLTFTLTQTLHPLFQQMASSTPQTVRMRLQEISPAVSFPFWKPSHVYEQGEVIQHEGWSYQRTSFGRSLHSFEEDLAKKHWEAKKPLPTALGFPGRGSFFLTDRGYQAFEHALERAKTYLAYQARCLEVSFSGTWTQLHPLTLDHTVFLDDPRLPGGKLHGKVIAYRMVAEGETGSQHVEVTLGVNTGAGEEPESLKDPEDELSYSPGYSHAGYHVSSPQQLQRSPTGIFYERYDQQKPEDPFATLAYQNLSFFIQQLQLKNSAHEQEDFLKTVETTGHVDKSSLKEKATELQLKFAPLKGKETMLHTIHATVRSRCHSPRQVG